MSTHHTRHHYWDVIIDNWSQICSKLSENYIIWKLNLFQWAACFPTKFEIWFPIIFLIQMCQLGKLNHHRLLYLVNSCSENYEKIGVMISASFLGEAKTKINILMKVLKAPSTWVVGVCLWLAGSFGLPSLQLC